MHAQLVKAKQDTATQIELAINEFKYQRRASEYATMEELAKKAKADAQKAVDDLVVFRDQLRML